MNDSVYRPPQPDDPDIISMAESMATDGVREPLTVSSDGFIISGHRRYCASGIAGIEMLPVIFDSVASTDDAFMKLLVMHNQQRTKSLSEVLNETVVRQSSEDAHRDLVQHRVKRSDDAFRAEAMDLGEVKERAGISPQKHEMLQAAIDAINELREYWPVSIRTIHYRLLNDPPLRNTTRGTLYRNDRNSYSDLSGLLTTARFHGIVPFEAIHDPTRPVVQWNAHRSAADYLRREQERFLRGYWRDLLQSQPDHIEVVGEKSTLLPIIQPVCEDYTVPLTIGRGFCSVPPRKAIAERFFNSGKERLVLILLSDHDPDGEVIATSLARTMRDDLGIDGDRIVAVRAALTRDQVDDLGLASDGQPAKAGSSNYASFVKQFGNEVFELEAVNPPDLQTILRDAIESVLDIEAFKTEQALEADDSAEIDELRQRMLAALRSSGGGW